MALGLQISTGMQWRRGLAGALVPVSIVASTVHASAQVPRGATIRPSETAIDDCSKVIERALATAGTGAHVSAGRSEPALRDVAVRGAVRTPEALVARRSGLQPGQTLTNASLRRAARRVIDLPVASCGWVRNLPQDERHALVEVGIDERPKFPTTWKSWAEIAGRALFVREVEVPLGGVTGRGDRIDLEYGFKTERPRTAIRLTAPAPGIVPGLAVFEYSWNRQAYQLPDPSADRLREERRTFRVGLEDWATERVHWHVDSTFDRLEERPFVALGGGIDTRWFSDRVSVRLESASWKGTDGAPSFRTGSITVHWRQVAAAIPRGFYAEAGALDASPETPLLIWSGADVGSSRQAFLRAHKLFTRGVVNSEVFGRQLAFASLTYERPVVTMRYGTASLVGFIDTARARHGLLGDALRAHVDVGLGARFHASTFGSVRLDVGYGLRDGQVAISAGFSRPWPHR